MNRRTIALRQFVAVTLALALAGCALFTREGARSVLDFAQVACILERATLGDAKVAELCSISDALLPLLRDLLAKQRAALAAAREEGEYAATHRAPLVLDAGVPRLTSP